MPTTPAKRGASRAALFVVFALVGVGIALVVAKPPEADVAAESDVDGDSEPPFQVYDVVGDGVPAASTSSARAAEGSDVLPSARFDFHRTKAGYQDSFYVLGEVQNTSPYAISKPELMIVMRDAEGNEVGTDSGFAMAEILEPGERSYLSAVVTSPPPHASLSFEVVPRKATYRPAAAEGLEVIENEPRVERGGIYKFSGRVHNGGSTRARFLNVGVLAFDADDKLLSIHFTYAKTDGLPPGEDARFQLTGAGFDEPPARVEYSVSGRVMD